MAGEHPNSEASTLPMAAASAEPLGRAAAPKARPAHKMPDHIGPFRILENVGEGGMGIVYRAEQREPVRRIVALKVIKLGMDTREVWRASTPNVRRWRCWRLP